MKLGTVASALAVTAALQAVEAAAQTQAGVASAVVSPVEVSGPPRPEPVAVATGMEMFLDDRIVTGPNARLQVLLLDETVFTVGPDTDLVIDRFVYDPASGTGEIAATMATGFLRYVSGRVGAATPENVSIETPAATIGIRGTALFVAAVPDRPGTFFCGVLGPGRDNNALARPGACRLTNEHGSVEVRRSGFGSYVTRGEAPSAPVPFPPGLIAEMQALLRPDDETLRAAGLPVPDTDGAADEVATGSAARRSGQSTAEIRGLGFQQAGLLVENVDFLSVSPESNIVNPLPPLPPITPDPRIEVPAFAQLTSNGAFDLDLHATGPNPSGQGRYHVFFANPRGPAGADGQPVVQLGAVTSTLPFSEVLSLNALTEGGVTRISVFNFTDQTFGSTTLADQAGAMVSLLQNGLLERGPGGSMVVNGDLIDQVVPAAGGRGNTWVAYEIGPDGIFRAVNRFTDSANPIVVE